MNLYKMIVYTFLTYLYFSWYIHDTFVTFHFLSPTNHTPWDVTTNPQRRRSGITLRAPWWLAIIMLTIMSQIRFPLHCCYATASSNSSTTSQVVLNGNTLSSSSRQEIRLGLPSKGRMSSDTLDLLKDCQLSVNQVNPRQYVAQIPQVSHYLHFPQH
jgi:hypothetical protein